MKELSLEQKAKRYDEALEGIRGYIKSLKNVHDGIWSAKDIENHLSWYFPELKESEDENIRKCIGDVVREYDWAHIFGITKDDCLSWLEKQGKQKSLSITDEWIEDYWQHEKVNNPYSYDKGEEIQFDHQGFVRFCKKYCKCEQKPTDNVEPKFHEGDWVVSPNGVYWHIDKISNNRYEVTSNTGESSDWPLDTNIYHRFSIQDAKDGDVLAGHETIVLFKKIEGQNIRCYCTYHFMNNPHFYVDTLQSKNPYFPAKKEQRDLLFQKIKDAGYEWDAEKKELKKIEQKPAWSITSKRPNRTLII